MTVATAIRVRPNGLHLVEKCLELNGTISMYREAFKSSRNSALNILQERHSRRRISILDAQAMEYPVDDRCRLVNCFLLVDLSFQAPIISADMPAAKCSRTGCLNDKDNLWVCRVA